MALDPFPFTIPSDGYSYEFGNSIESSSLDGGLLNLRNGISTVSGIANIKLELDKTDYGFFVAFYEIATIKGSLPFTIELSIDNSTLTEHQAVFVPDSISLNVDGIRHIVSFQLRVNQNVNT